MKLKQNLGFTLFELITALIALACLAFGVFLIYCLVHFVAKFW